MYKVLTVMGTRPEAIKLFPLLQKMESDERFHSVVASTGQQGAILGGIVKELGIKIDHLGNVLRYDLMPKGGNDLITTETRISKAVSSWLQHVDPDVVIVHGDTATASATARTSFLSGYPVAHVEAGNRSGNKREPFPEEMNRIMIAILASLHFPSTEHAKSNLLKENVPEDSIHVTGSTIIDSMQLVMDDTMLFDFSISAQKQVLVTMHRKENMEQGGIDRVAESVRIILNSIPGVSVKWLRPSNPSAMPSSSDELEQIDGFEFIPPQKYRDFLSIVQSSSLIICDSGGLQEEAYVFGIPTIVARTVTERPEAFNTASMFLIRPDDPQFIAQQAVKILQSGITPKPLTSHGFGKGNAADIILDKMFNFCQLPRRLPKPSENSGFYMG